MAFSAICYLRKNLNGLLSWNSNSKNKAIQNNREANIASQWISMFFCLQTIYLHFIKYTLFKIKLHCINPSYSSFLFATTYFSLFFHEIRNEHLFPHTKGKTCNNLGASSRKYWWELYLLVNIFMISVIFKYHWAKKCSLNFLHTVLYCVVHFLDHINHSINRRLVLQLVWWPPVFKYEKRFYRQDVWSLWFEN